MSHVIQLDDDLSHSISALAHALSAEISDDNVPSNNFENIYYDAQTLRKNFQEVIDNL